MSMTMSAMPHEQLSAESLIEQIVREATPSQVCLTSSFQTEDMVVLHMLRSYLPQVPVIFLETGYHFAELLAYRDRMAAEWDLRLINVVPHESRAEHEAKRGLLYIVQPTECCQLRKVEPLMRSLEPYTWWFTGLRREQSPTRAGLKKIEDHKLPSGRELKKISVLADWSWSQVLAYAEQHRIPQLELYAKGYTSIGCEPCTAVPEEGADPRSGRWGGKKLECGIHTFSEKT